MGENNTLSGSKSRLAVIKLAKFIQLKFQAGQISKSIVELINCLVEIISICYSREKFRSPKQILRLYNQTFLFAVLCTDIIGNPVKLNSGRFYGSHFHTLLTHAPETYRLICLRSVVTENEERSFKDLRDISKNTTNRHCGQIIDNAMVRFQAQQKYGQKQNSLQQTDSIISKQSSLLPVRGPTILSSSFLRSRSSLVQTHLERIADFLALGEGPWWKIVDGDIIFADGPTDPHFHAAGPPLHHFRSSSLQEQIYVRNIWLSCVKKFKDNNLSLPLKKIRTFENGKLLFVQQSDVQDQTLPGKTSILSTKHYDQMLFVSIS